MLNAEKKLLEFKKIDENKNRKLLYSSIIILLFLLVIIMGLYMSIKQISKVHLDSTLMEAQDVYEINVKLDELEKRINKLEQ